MPKIIKDEHITDDNWVLVSDSEISQAADLPAGDLLLPLAVYKALHSELGDRQLAVWLNSDEAPSELEGLEKTLPLIAINFPAFADGRGYSYAHILREQLGFTGELRAIGDVLKDQLYYMKRVGFNSFAMRDDQNLEEALNHLHDFTTPYQAAVDRKTPLFAQR
jgi:uncharacterized protein (DUF934 family)